MAFRRAAALLKALPSAVLGVSQLRGLPCLGEHSLRVIKVSGGSAAALVTPDAVQRFLSDLTGDPGDGNVQRGGVHQSVRALQSPEGTSGPGHSAGFRRSAVHHCCSTGADGDLWSRSQNGRSVDQGGNPRPAAATSVRTSPEPGPESGSVQRAAGKYDKKCVNTDTGIVSMLVPVPRPYGVSVPQKSQVTLHVCREVRLRLVKRHIQAQNLHVSNISFQGCSTTPTSTSRSRGPRRTPSRRSWRRPSPPCYEELRSSWPEDSGGEGEERLETGGTGTIRTQTDLDVGLWNVSRSKRSNV